MLQVETPIHPEMTQAERFFAIHQAYMKDRSQMTLLLAHTVQIPEVAIMRALEGDSAHELDFSRWEEIIRAFEELAVCMSSYRMEQQRSRSTVSSAGSRMLMAF